MRNDGGSGRWRDLAWAAGLAVIMLISSAVSPPNRIELDPVGGLLLVVGAMTVAFRRRATVPMLAIAIACELVYQALGYPGLAPTVPVFFALYAAVKAGHRAAAGTAIGILLLGGFVAERAFGPGQPEHYGLQGWILLIGWMVAASAMGEVSRQHAAYLNQVEQRAVDAERTREETALRRADEERLRIARELHDSLTHSISLIKVQAGVAVHLARKRDEPVPDELLAIEQASAEAMRELRATLEVLRNDGASAGSSLDRLENLVDGARKAGVPVTVSVSGQPRDLPGPVDRAAYRIIQEALTNIARHAGPATVSVQLGYTDDELTVSVDDNGRGNAETTVAPGVGLIGMRERVTALGGSLHVGARREGGFRVRAELPLEALT